MTEIKELKKQFLEYLEIERGRSLKTIENYGRYLRTKSSVIPSGLEIFEKSKNRSR